MAPTPSPPPAAASSPAPTSSASPTAPPRAAAPPPASPPTRSAPTTAATTPTSSPPSTSPSTTAPTSSPSPSAASATATSPTPSPSAPSTPSPGASPSSAPPETTAHPPAPSATPPPGTSPSPLAPPAASSSPASRSAASGTSRPSTFDKPFIMMPILRQGLSLASKHQPPRKYFRMIDAAQAAASSVSPEEAQLCYAGSLDPRKVRGKIVVCVQGDIDRMLKALEVYKAGGAGMILTNTDDSGEDVIADPYMIPAVYVGYAAAATIYSYLNSTGPHMGHIGAPKAHYGLKPAPLVADFSSRGPNYLTPEILKPDILAPGVDILAAFSQAASPSEEDFDSRRVAFNILSGTSMSCPHVSGVVGLLKVLHPHWSPAALRSAIMTTARTRDNTGKTIKDFYSTKANPFDYGAGHIQPNRAADPGLVYDLTDNDYLNLLCALGYNSSELSKFASRVFVCPHKPIHIKDLNYPSITVNNLRALTTVRRTLKNVSRPSTYIARVKAPLGISVSVKPRILKFEKRGEVKTFKIRMAKKANAVKDYAFGQLIWSDGKHNVRSPLVVKAI